VIVEPEVPVEEFWLEVVFANSSPQIRRVVASVFVAAVLDVALVSGFCDTVTNGLGVCTPAEMETNGHVTDSLETMPPTLMDW
jgi:hypothetical protein